MTNQNPLTDTILLQQEAYEYLIKKDYHKAAKLYEKAIVIEPKQKSYYWYLGLILLLQGEEAQAQTTWLLGMAEGEPEEIDLWTAELIEVLQTEAARRGEIKDYEMAWAIRQHIREINPTDINNLLHLIGLSILLETYTGEVLIDMGVIDILQSEPPVNVNVKLLMEVLKSVLDYDALHPSSLELTKACVNHVRDPLVFLEAVLGTAVKIGYGSHLPLLALAFTQVCRMLDVEKFGKNLNPLAVLPHMASFYQNSGQYDEGIKIAKEFLELSEELPDKTFANHKVLRGLMSAGGYWDEVSSVMDQHEVLIDSMIEEKPAYIHPARVQNLFATTFFLPYFADRAQKNRNLQNKLAQFCQEYLQKHHRERVERYQKGHLARKQTGDVSKRPLRIGYLSHCMLRHSVGWLSRWLFQYHNRDRVSIYAYFIGYRKTPDALQEWFAEQADYCYKGEFSETDIADKIYEDEIDILIDLDSITLDVTCTILSLKPAPVQVTWLGWDGSGLPAIDYFIADPYVLPENAEDYYHEKIWRLPDTYIAVGGFELGLPTLRREELEIPSDAVVYLSSQKSYKRHPDTAILQMRIIKEVPDSYFLIKGPADETSMQNFFYQLAEKEGVSRDRLRFLPEAPLEQVHRANLGIADIVLDTYPYNGATTTLETLWVGIPLVTRVGQQFSARNSYAMMVNAGITEGIAWTDEEYIEWGIRLGKEPLLRQHISWKMWMSRRTSPLWNPQKFAREMENAYEQMWLKYLDT
ncbi:MAG: hypothetical protein RLZZ338_1960 [Cyanobacteriota bacterium]|jgi:predicted O-linked N-acetylglucosamine transferase (SPINDLY family)